jgi:hypothetical protein
MAGRASAFAALGLDPGADVAAVEQAYRRLIKQHHPDREGGDASRAAEINRAYREIRGGKAVADPFQFNEVQQPARRRSRWPTAALIACAGAIGALLMMGPAMDQSLSSAGAQMRVAKVAAAPVHTDPVDGSLNVSAIDDAVAQAVRLYRTSDEETLANVSRDCQRRFRDNPRPSQLDRCAAFDDAVVGLQDRDPLRDGGPFAPLAVTGRQWSAASTLSDDDLAIDGRLDRIRLQVELLLAPIMEPVAPAAGAGPQR